MDPATALEQLQQPQTLSIVNLSEPILNAALIAQSQNTDSQPSSTSFADPKAQTPSTLAADLTHYQELFSKLRFSYVEQVTKERFLRAVVAEQPEFVTAAENAELEEALKGDKEALKQKKAEVREMIGELEEQGRMLARRYEQISLQTAQLETLPGDIENLQQVVEELRQKQEPRSENPEMAMPLRPTLDLLQEREQELQSMDLEIERLQAALPAKKAEVQRLQDELAPIQMRKIKAVEEAKEARRRRENGGMADELEEKGRWLRGVETTMKAMLEI
ncbi:Kinetochore protein Sos7 [Pseudocercospora fuligena]|uniref:Kinetochore protein Sos7 n=1 Tax=Pseudocercospora fuligena TaxID=685502 RepID=A0A8H6RDJ9_9PEZI|nr:Kinetochore protein Sos7 [Pseudocercospora fuligena]